MVWNISYHKNEFNCIAKYNGTYTIGKRHLIASRIN